MHAHRPAPTEPSRVALLLELCGYDVRQRTILEMKGCSGLWLPVPMPSGIEPTMQFLNLAADRDWPVRTMDANDARLEAVFAAEYPDAI